MAHDGRTPSLTLSGASQTLVLEGVHSAFPFGGRQRTRKYEVSETREGASGAGKEIKIFPRYNNTGEKMSVTVPYCTAAQYAMLDAMISNDPPDVNVTYDAHGLTSESFALIELSDKPDDWDWVNDPSFEVSFVLDRNTA